MSEFDLRAAIRAVMDETDLSSPDEIANKVAEGIPRDHLRSVLAQTLRVFVHLEITRARSGLLVEPANTARPNRSAKVTAIREAAPKWMRDRVYVGEWMLLGQCTYENLMYLVDDRMMHAAQNEAAAERYRRIADEVKRAKVSCVADLPKAALRRLDGEVAA